MQNDLTDKTHEVFDKVYELKNKPTELETYLEKNIEIILDHIIRTNGINGLLEHKISQSHGVLIKKNKIENDSENEEFNYKENAKKEPEKFIDELIKNMKNLESDQIPPFYMNNQKFQFAVKNTTEYLKKNKNNPNILKVIRKYGQTEEEIKKEKSEYSKILTKIAKTVSEQHAKIQYQHSIGSDFSGEGDFPPLTRLSKSRNKYKKARSMTIPKQNFEQQIKETEYLKKASSKMSEIKEISSKEERNLKNPYLLRKNRADSESKPNNPYFSIRKRKYSIATVKKESKNQSMISHPLEVDLALVGRKFPQEKGYHQF